jgi:hypothetical protein
VEKDGDGNASSREKSLENGLVNVLESGRVEEMQGEGSNSLTIRPSCCLKRNRGIRGMTRTVVLALLSSARGIVSVGTGEDYVPSLGWGIVVGQGDSTHSSLVELLLALKSEGGERQISQVRTKSQ